MIEELLATRTLGKNSLRRAGKRPKDLRSETKTELGTQNSLKVQ